MHYASLELEKFDDYSNNEYNYSYEDYCNIDPIDILQKSYDHVSTDALREQLVGSTTAILLILRVINNTKMHIDNQT